MLTQTCIERVGSCTYSIPRRRAHPQLAGASCGPRRTSRRHLPLRHLPLPPLQKRQGGRREVLVRRRRAGRRLRRRRRLLLLLRLLLLVGGREGRGGGAPRTMAAAAAATRVMVWGQAPDNLSTKSTGKSLVARGDGSANLRSEGHGCDVYSSKPGIVPLSPVLII